MRVWQAKTYVSPVPAGWLRKAAAGCTQSKVSGAISDICTIPDARQDTYREHGDVCEARGGMCRPRRDTCREHGDVSEGGGDVLEE